MSEEWIDSEEEQYWDCYDENDEDLLTYFNIPELVFRDESEKNSGNFESGLDIFHFCHVVNCNCLCDFQNLDG